MDQMDRVYTLARLGEVVLKTVKDFGLLVEKKARRASSGKKRGRKQKLSDNPQAVAARERRAGKEEKKATKPGPVPTARAEQTTGKGAKLAEVSEA